MKKHVITALLLTVCLLAFRSILCLPAFDQTSRTIEHSFNNQLSVKLPQSAKVVENHFSDNGELLHSIYFDDEEMLFRGYIQLWTINDIESFLVKSKDLSSFNYKSFSLNPITVGPFSGIINEWTASFSNIYSISGREYWLKKADNLEVLRISFFTDDNMFTDEQLRQVDSILCTIQWK